MLSWFYIIQSILRFRKILFHQASNFISTYSEYCCYWFLFTFYFNNRHGIDILMMSFYLKYCAKLLNVWKRLLFHSRQLANYEDKKTKRKRRIKKSVFNSNKSQTANICCCYSNWNIVNMYIMLNYFLRKIKSEANQNEFGMLKSWMCN